MLNGQLPLTTFAIPRMSSSRRVLLVSGVLGLALITGCSSTPNSRAPVVDLSKQPPTSGTAAPGGTYVVKPGDTLFQIARNHGVSIQNLRQWNNISDANQLNVGQVLRLGPGASTGTVAGATSGASTSGPAATPSPVVPPTTPSTGSATDTTPPAGGTTAPTGNTATTPTATIPAPATPSKPRAADANLISWGWPANGPIIQTFTTANKGIDIGGALGAPVVAAADGKVMYSGNGVRGLGNLIIVNHDNGFITAYAHNQTLLVKTGEAVKRGTKIAEIGQSDTTSPRLHFEIRRQGTPVDPLQYLPAR
ncbi:peptidoglycan DD-metalloendopeptidase family protein [Bordetella sp. 02P26C-1]|uniref:peptidoglycan DD-metalloendopeptidase family protein n=1 Tax=Bordetella sp. 02P26C-1 TaxID=2683195 RepID=UPI0013550B8E|nr:peptidoglycan DD-metalloendopeptidase family protein [Bordetella sp. 02P26C-1]MVW79971.1 peptidoglycan DD-metalloendopeptidase family protein [Bordetella sp. 02P26C-1]